MTNNALQSSELLKKVLFELPHGMPVSTTSLKRAGVSRQLTHYYVQAGWLTKLGNGYYLRVGDQLTATGAVAALQNNGIHIHIGGKSALALKGFYHYLHLGESELTLYGSGVRTLPDWFLERFKALLHKKRLFDEVGEKVQSFGLAPLEDDPCAPLTSQSERAVLELLALVPQQQTLEEARQILEGLQSLRSKPLQTLLEQCLVIKVKRLFWMVASELQLPVMKKLNPATIDFGAMSNYVIKGETNLILKNPHG